MPDDLTDAKIAAVEARTDAKFAQLIGGIDNQFAELKGELRVVQTSTSGLKGTIIGTGVALFLGLAAVFVGVLAYGSGAFYNGTVLSDAVNTAVVEKLKQAAPKTP